MTGFVSYAGQLQPFLERVVRAPHLHARWLNTLSYLENCGARKIAACEHPTLVKEEMLKHAAEEFRHALHLKRQIGRVIPSVLPTYSQQNLLGGFSTRHYLDALDLLVVRYLKTAGLAGASLREAAYTLVTYAIELRAEELYPLYHAVLREVGSKVAVKSIILEEKEHLKEMEEELEKLPKGAVFAGHVSALESLLCGRWVQALGC